MADTWENFGTNKDFSNICLHKYLWEFLVTNKILTQLFLQKYKKQKQCFNGSLSSGTGLTTVSFLNGHSFEQRFQLE